LLSEIDPVEAIEQENGVPVDDVLRPVNSLHGAFESAPVHALGLCDVIADPAIGAELSRSANAPVRARSRGVSRCER
jgi:hypothetical protein